VSFSFRSLFEYTGGEQMLIDLDCGGCNFGPGSMTVGVDCTDLYDGEVACIEGQCIPGSVSR
jgi:hypothetical protein